MGFKSLVRPKTNKIMTIIIKERRRRILIGQTIFIKLGLFGVVIVNGVPNETAPTIFGNLSLKVAVMFLKEVEPPLPSFELSKMTVLVTVLLPSVNTNS